jgi:hypothetical protein
VEIGGQPRPENAMSKESGVTKAERARQVIKGLKSVYPTNQKVILGGKAYMRDDVIALYRSHLAALDAKTARYGAYQQAVADERAIAAKTNDLWVTLYGVVLNLKGEPGLNALGMKRRRKPGPKKVEAKLAGVQKRAAKKRSS